MVKGISRQVLVVQGAEPKLFEQAIFILKDNAPEVTEDALLKEAERLMQSGAPKRKLWHYGAFWASLGASATGLAWLLTIFLA